MRSECRAGDPATRQLLAGERGSEDEFATAAEIAVGCDPATGGRPVTVGEPPRFGNSAAPGRPATPGKLREPPWLAELVTEDKPATAGKSRESRITSAHSSARKARCGSGSGYFFRISFSAAASASNPAHQYRNEWKTIVPALKIFCTRPGSLPATCTIMSTNSALRNSWRTSGRMLMYSASSSVYLTGIVSGRGTRHSDIRVCRRLFLSGVRGRGR